MCVDTVSVLLLLDFFLHELWLKYKFFCLTSLTFETITTNYTLAVPKHCYLNAVWLALQSSNLIETHHEQRNESYDCSQPWSNHVWFKKNFSCNLQENKIK